MLIGAGGASKSTSSLDKSKLDIARFRPSDMLRVIPCQSSRLLNLVFQITSLGGVRHHRHRAPCSCPGETKPYTASGKWPFTLAESAQMSCGSLLMSWEASIARGSIRCKMLSDIPSPIVTTQLRKPKPRRCSHIILHRSEVCVARHCDSD